MHVIGVWHQTREPETQKVSGEVKKTVDKIKEFKAKNPETTANVGTETKPRSQHPSDLKNPFNRYAKALALRLNKLGIGNECVEPPHSNRLGALKLFDDMVAQLPDEFFTFKEGKKYLDLEKTFEELLRPEHVDSDGTVPSALFLLTAMKTRQKLTPEKISEIIIGVHFKRSDIILQQALTKKKNVLVVGAFHARHYQPSNKISVDFTRPLDPQRVQEIRQLSQYAYKNNKAFINKLVDEFKNAEEKMKSKTGLIIHYKGIPLQFS